MQSKTCKNPDFKCDWRVLSLFKLRKWFERFCTAKRFDKEWYWEISLNHFLLLCNSRLFMTVARITVVKTAWSICEVIAENFVPIKQTYILFLKFIVRCSWTTFGTEASVSFHLYPLHRLIIFRLNTYHALQQQNKKSKIYCKKSLNVINIKIFQI